MPYDLDTFANLYPYPLKDQFRQTIEKQILSGELKIPQDRVLDSKLWIAEKTDEQYKKEKNLWNVSQNEADEAWQKNQEIEHGFNHLPDDLKRGIHSQVWQDSHSGGYGDMLNSYCDWVPLIIEAYKAGPKEHLRK